jgi:hypothetical protein
MYANYNFYALQDREIREQDLAERIAERKKQALTASRKPSPPAQIARRLFALALAADKNATWRVFWRGWKRREAYETKLVARSSRTRRDALYPP